MENKDLLIISVLTFITVSLWIFFDAYHVYTTSTIPADLKIQLEPLNIKISLDDIRSLGKRPELFPITQEAIVSDQPISSPSAIP